MTFNQDTGAFDNTRDAVFFFFFVYHEITIRHEIQNKVHVNTNNLLYILIEIVINLRVVSNLKVEFN